MNRNWVLAGAALGLVPAAGKAAESSAADTAAEAGSAVDAAAEAAAEDKVYAPVDAEEAITVSATRTPTPVDRVPATVTVIGDQQIADQLAGDVKDLVRFEPGVSVRRAPARFGAAFGATGREGNAGFTIRGIGGNRVLIQVDGVRVPDSFSFGAQAAGRGDYVDIGLIKSVEILRGPASALYGSDGLAGAVSFITSDPADLIGAGRNFGALGRIGYDSASDEFSETAVLASNLGPVSALIGYTRRDGKELENQGATGGTGALRTEPNPQDSASNALLGKLVFSPAAGHKLRLSGEFSDGRVASHVLSAPASVASLTTRDRIERSRLSLDWSMAGEGLVESAQAAVYWQDSKNSQFAVEDRTVLADRERLNTFDNRVFGASADARTSFATGAIDHRLIIGGDLSFTRQSGVRDGTVPTPPDVFPTRAFPVTDFTLAGLFVGDEISVGDGVVTLHPALRFDHYSLNAKDDPLLPAFEAADQSGSRLTPRIGAIGKLGGGFSAYGSFAFGFKAPSPTQVNQFFENLTSPFFSYRTIPNPGLKPETSRTFEAGLRYGGDRVHASLTGFVGRYRDFISQETVAGSGTIADPIIFQFVNLDRVKVHGIEGRASLDLPAGFNADLGLAWADGKVIDPGGDTSSLSTIDPLKVVAAAGWRDPDGRYGAQLNLTYSARKEAKDTDGVCTGDCFRPGAFTILDATAFYELAKGLVVRGGLFNITDEKYAWWSDVVGLLASAGDHDAYTQPGRNFRVSLSYRY